MIKVTRTAKPHSLEQHAAAWTQTLQDEIRVKGDYKHVSKTHKNHYRQDDVRESLHAMYFRKCCYCESLIGAASYEHIEHLKPKSDPRFHHLSFEWDNLHWACQICNNKKWNKWDDVAPILDPTEDDPSEHLIFNLIDCTVQPKNGSPRGRTTIEHAKLNRPELIVARERVRDAALDFIAQAQQTGSDFDLQFYKRKLLEMTTSTSDRSAYTLFIQQLVEEYLGDIL